MPLHGSKGLPRARNPPLPIERRRQVTPIVELVSDVNVMPALQCALGAGDL